MRIEALINNQLTKSIRIISKKGLFTGKKTYYAINTTGKKLAEFQFTPTGEINGLSLKKQYRRKKEGLCTLFAIKRFIERLGKKDKIHVAKFVADSENPHNVDRLYEKFATPVEDSNWVYYLWGLTKKGKKDVAVIKEFLC